jgi:hypothetical protein
MDPSTDRNVHGFSVHVYVHVHITDMQAAKEDHNY